VAGKIIMKSSVTDINCQISVIVTTFNRVDLLKRCLDSLAAQTFKNFEVIVADDGSTDGSSDVVSSFQDRLSIVYSWSENWGGPAVPRNRGVSLARGRWIAFLDSDDYFFRSKLQKLAEYADSATDDVAVLYHPMVYVGAGGTSGKLRVRDLSNNSWRKLVSLGNGVALSGAMVRAEVIRSVGGFLEVKEIIGSEDYDLWLRIAQSRFGFRRINEVLGAYELDSSAKLSGANSKILERCTNVLDFYQSSMSSLEKRLSRGYLAYFEGMLSLTRRDYAAATASFISAFVLSHWSIKARSALRLVQVQLFRFVLR
jgi:glycosyltransferase involved in cell wall biosynthesis